MSVKLFNKLLQFVAKPKIETVPEFEVYDCKIFDSTTNHSYVEFTGSEEACIAFAENLNQNKNQKNKLSVRPTGETVLKPM